MLVGVKAGVTEQLCERESKKRVTKNPISNVWDNLGT